MKIYYTLAVELFTCAHTIIAHELHHTVHQQRLTQLHLISNNLSRTEFFRWHLCREIYIKLLMFTNAFHINSFKCHPAAKNYVNWLVIFIPYAVTIGDHNYFFPSHISICFVAALIIMVQHKPTIKRLQWSTDYGLDHCYIISSNAMIYTFYSKRAGATGHS